MERHISELDSQYTPEVLKTVRQDPFLANLKEINEITPVSNGVSHYVYKITTDKDNFFLKIRENHFSRLPEIAIRPEDIKSEYKALTIYESFMPNNFPQIVSFSDQKHYLITTDATFNGMLFQETLISGDATGEMVYNLGSTLKEIHTSTAAYTDDIREEGDSTHYDLKLLHRFEFAKNDGLDEVVEKLKKQKKQLILGDPAPKNIGINNNGLLFIFFDLEDAHQGNPIFDCGYLLGHILLHNLLDPKKASELADDYTSGYGIEKFDEDMLKKIALGIVRYRLGGKIPYPAPNIPQDMKIPIMNRIENIFQVNLKTSDWTTIFTYLKA